MIITLAASAFGQPFTTTSFPVLDETASPLVANGVGAPTVAWDPVDERYVMFFETRTGAATPGDCPNGTWAIGVASSDDGLSWTVWPSYAIEPTPGTPWRCVAAHPTVLYEAGTFHLWFKAEQGVVPAGCGNSWGCKNYSGVGYASVSLQLDDKTAEIAALQDQIAALDAALDQAVLDFDGALAAYEATLIGGASVFSCVDGLSVCAPCTGATFTASNGVSTTRDFCQPFSFAIPATIPRTTGTGALYSPVLTFDLGGGASTTCTWFGSTWFALQVFVGCSNGATVGTVVTADHVVLTNGSLFGNVTVGTTLVPTNAQTFDGPLFDQLDALRAVTSIPDPAATAASLPAWITTLQDLAAWLDDVPGDPARAALHAATLTAIADAQALLALIADTDAQIADLQDQIAALQAYVPGVTVSPASGVALRLNRVFGYPNVAKLGGDYVLLVQDYPNLRRATGATPTSFVVDPTPAISAGAVSWAMSEVYEPAMTCSGDPLLPYEAWIGGRTTVGGLFTEAGLSDAVSADGASWLLNLVPWLSWTDPDEYRHFDALRASTGETRIWYSEKDGSGINRIGLMSSSTDPWVDADSTNRVCP